MSVYRQGAGTGLVRRLGRITSSTNAVATGGLGTSNYLAGSTPSATEPLSTGFSVGAMFRLDDFAWTGTHTIVGNGNGTTLGWSLQLVEGAGIREIRCRCTGLTALDFTLSADDVGKTFIMLLALDSTSAEFWLYKAGDGSAALVFPDTSIGTVIANTAAMAVGVRDAASAGTAPLGTIASVVGVTFGTTKADRASARTWMQSSAAANRVTSIAGATHTWNADRGWTDEVGSEHLSTVGTPTTVAFTPEYRIPDAVNLWYWLGQSNAKGTLALVDVPTSPVDYSAAFANCRLMPGVPGAGQPDFGDLVPYGDAGWAGELSAGRGLYAQVGAQYTPHILKRADGSTALADEWSPAGGGSQWVTLEGHMTDLFDGGKSTSILAPVICHGVFWIQGESDAAVEAYANAYENNLTAFLSEFDSGYFRNTNTWVTKAGDFLFVAAKIPVFDVSVTYRTTVNAAMDAVAAARADVVTVDTDALSDAGDAIHFDAASHVLLGTAMVQAWASRDNVTIEAP